MSNARANAQFHVSTIVDVLRHIPYTLWSAIADGTSTTDITTYVQEAVDQANDIGGGVVSVPAGMYRVQNVKAKDKVTVRGVLGGTIFKVVDGVDKQVFYNPDQATTTTVDYFGLEGLIMDGNSSVAPRVVAASACAINGVTYFRARDCVFRNASGYGMGFQAYAGTTLLGQQFKIYLENCHFLNNGIGAASGGDTYDGIDVKDCDEFVMIGGAASGNSDKGINIRGEKVQIFGAYASNNGASGFEFAGNNNGEAVATTLNLLGCEARSNGGAGFAVADGFGAPTQPVRVNLSNVVSVGNLFGVQVPSGGTFVELDVSGANILSNTSDGIIISSTPRSCTIRGGTIRSNGGDGIKVNGADVQIDSVKILNNDGYGIEQQAGGTRIIVSGACRVTGNAFGNFSWLANGRRHVSPTVSDFDIGTDDVIPSAATITLPEGGELFVISGVTNIDNITASRRGRRIVLQFSGILTVNDGAGNLGLAGNFTTSSADTLSLVCDGTNWLEVGRSVN